MSSTYTLYPSSVGDSTPARQGRVNEPRSLPSNDAQHPIPPSTPVASGTHLSAFSPQLRLRSISSSPALNTHTPADSTTLSIHYQSSEFSDFGDPFLGVDFGATDADAPSFLEGDIFNPGSTEVNVDAIPHHTTDHAQDAHQHAGYLPLSPIKTPSLHTASPNGDRKADRARFPGQPQNIVVAHALTDIQPFPSLETPSGSGSGRSSDDGLAPAPNMMPAQSPRLTVSMWGRDGAGVPLSLDTAQHYEGYGNIAEVSGAYNMDPVPAPAALRDGTGRWVPDSTTGQGGLDPQNRPATEGPSVNELDQQRKSAERKRQVGSWVEKAASEAGDPDQPPPEPVDLDKTLPQLPQEEIDPHVMTENNRVPGQLYFNMKGGELTEEDVELIRRNRNWEAAPLPFEITTTRRQPETSQDAIRKFERMCRDTDSVVSVAATWGTRRRSLPGIDAINDVTSGNLFTKLTIRGDTPSSRRPSLIGRIQTLVRKPSATFNKRPREGDDNRSIATADSSTDKSPGLAPPNRVSSWGKNKNPVPSINTAFVAMGSSVASIGTTHAHSRSISAATPTITSPRGTSSFNLSVVKGPLQRFRSSSDLTKAPPSGLAGMWREAGGPPVASLVNTAAAAPAADADDDDDDEEDMYEDSESRSEANQMMVEITPDLPGFRQHILKLNPGLVTGNTYLVDRIAHQQIVRYKGLLNARVKHLQATEARSCSAGALCIAQGGAANVLDPKGDGRGMDPLSAQYAGSDEDGTPLEGPGVITQDSFPVDIPMPPTTILPAEFECQLCFQGKKFQKPSDWTKHVHEDVQPFTCTWDRCRDPKIFKRKADWVRHENEGHRHLEWWDCDVEDCRHVCYRRDNFLQHLVREHKYPEPKVKTKAAIKRAGGQDPTWQRVEQCHKETRRMPHDEPCRFCGKTFPTWKKLTVHLAKHMEQISLPILKLVARKELEPDTIISPVQDPPPRSFPAIFPIKAEPQLYDTTTPIHAYPPMNGHVAYPRQLPQQLHQPPRQQPYVQQQQQQHQSPFPGYIAPQFSSPIFPNGGFNGLAQSGVDHSPMTIHTPTTHPGFPTLDMSAFPVQPMSIPSPNNNHNGYNATNMTGPSSSPYISPDIEQFAGLSVNGLGLQNPGAQVYNGNGNGMLGEVYSPEQQQGQQHYTPQGSVSPYGHSPMQGQGGFYQ